LAQFLLLNCRIQLTLKYSTLNLDLINLTAFGKEHSMRVLNRYRSTVIAVGVVVVLAQTTAQAASVLFSAAGVGTGSIQATVDSFRAAVGNPNNGNNPGELASGRREINWDGGGVMNNPGGTPFNAFQNIRGALFTTPGSGFTQSPVAAGGLDTVFGNPTYAGLFTTFSPARVFVPVGSNITDVTFFIPGSTVPATVTAFGAVFTDVDLANVTTMQFFDVGGASLGTFNVPNAVGATETLSFLGVQFNAGEQVSRVRMITGNAPLSAAAIEGPNTDLVGIDDLIYDEPASVPESSTLILLGAGLVALGVGFAHRWKR
jgi:hypothetical protein